MGHPRVYTRDTQIGSRRASNQFLIQLRGKGFILRRILEFP